MNDEKMLGAARMAMELRFCPPDRLLFASPRDEATERHLGICNLCRERLEMDEEELSAWKPLMEAATAHLPRPYTPAPLPGQVWSLSEGLGGWGRYLRYYNAPMVMILRRRQGGDLLVAQISPGPALMGPGDLLLEKGLGFAQAWNTSLVPAEALAACQADLGEATAQAVLKAARESHSVPADSPLRAFRERETDLLETITARALETSAGRDPVGSLEDAFNSLRLLGAKITLGVRNAAEAMAMAVYPPQWAPAQAAEGDKITVTVVSGTGGQMVAEPLTASLVSTWDGDDITLVSDPLPLKDVPTRIQAWYVVTDSEPDADDADPVILQAASAELNKDKSFTLTFDDFEEPEFVLANLKVVVFIQ